MSERVEKSLGVVLKGGAFTLLGAVLGNFFGFASKLVITRASDPEVFGLFSLCTGIVGIIYIGSNLGLSIGVARYIPFFKGKGDALKSRDASIVALNAGTGISLVFFVAAFFSADFVAERFFPKIENLSYLLKVIFLTVPLYSFLELTIGIARGHGDVIPKVYFLDVIKNGLLFLLILAAIPFGISISTIVYAYVASIVAPSVIASLYMSKKYGVGLLSKRVPQLPKREIILFSLPLMMMPIMWLVLGTMDTVMLGYFKDPAEVGIYNASVSLARVFNTIAAPIMFMFLPVATEYFAKQSFTELSFLYKIFTKWIFSVSLPIFMILMFFPEIIITTLFGARYIEGAMCLRIIVLGYLSSLILGINNVALTASGKTMVQMWLSVATIGLNFVLNIFLIPRYGSNGAALATALSFTAFNVLVSLVLYRHAKVQPFSANYFKAIAAAFISLGLFYLLLGYLSAGLRLIPFFLVFYSISYMAFMILFSGINKYDLIMLDILERKSGRKFFRLRKLLARFDKHGG
ncbi:MAG: flippase [Deltaproteobacteria bacterium]|nr:flippase [Deltaproteobacteria bacterium]